MERIVFSVRIMLGVPLGLSIGRFALMVSEIPDSTVAVNVHTGDVVYTAEELFSVSDSDLLVKCLRVR